MRRGIACLLGLYALTAVSEARPVTPISDLAERAAACDRHLQQSSELRKYRANWQRCIERYADLVAASSDDTAKRSALKRQTELAQELARRSGRQDDDQAAQRLLAHFTASAMSKAPPSTSPAPVRVVIDPGHGGKDPGTVGANGLQEKEVVLDVAKRVQKLLSQREHIEPFLTRSDDHFLSLEERTTFAQRREADVFISIHANSSPRRDAKGIEVYVLGTASDADADATAARENDEPGRAQPDVSALIQSMLGDLSTSRQEEQSLELADTLRRSVIQRVEGRYDLIDLGIKRAPFYVLLNAGVPSILSELAFLSNPDDAARLRRPEFRQLIAEALATGIAKYAASSLLAQSN
jgi:N-acetylmuramoyl-L-alanine amidase